MSLSAEPASAQDAAALAERSDAVCRIGAMMLLSGTASYRVKLAMGRVAAALDLDSLQAQVTLNEIVMTTSSGSASLTRVVEVPTPAVDTDRIGELMRLTLRLRPGLDVLDLHEQLDAIERRPHLYRRPLLCAAAALACIAFAFLNHGGWLDCLVAGLAAAVGKWVQLQLRPRHVNPLVVVALAAASACSTAALAGTVLQTLLPPDPVSEVAVIASVLFLVPGFPLLTAALDLARFDFASGMSRLLYAALLMGAATMGLWPVAWAITLAPAGSLGPDLSWPILLTLRCLASFAGVFGFAVTFNAPLRIILATSTIGMIANVLRLSAVDLGANSLLCAAGATLLIGLLAGMVNQRLLAARITLSVPAVVIMIPGVVTYDSILAVVTGQPLDAVAYGLTSVSTVAALAVGLVVSRMVTDPAWTTPKPTWTRPPHTRAMDRIQADVVSAVE